MRIPYIEYFVTTPENIIYISYIHKPSIYLLEIFIEARDDFTNVNCLGLYNITVSKSRKLLWYK